MKKLLILTAALLMALVITAQSFPIPIVSSVTQNFRQSPNGTIITTVPAGNKLVATSITGDGWYFTFKPSVNNSNNTGYVKAGSGYFNPIGNTPYVRVQNTGSTGLNVRTGPGTNYSQITISGQVAKVWDTHYFATTGTSQVVSGSTWYQIYLTNDCSQTTGWVGNGVGSGFNYLVYYPPLQITNYTINTSSNPSAGGTTSGGGSYAVSSYVTVTAIANAGYTFYRWEENGNPVSTSASYSFTVAGNRTLVARFNSVVTNYTISTSSSPTAGGTTTGGGTYASGSTATVSASPNSGYSFYRWEENGAAVSTSASYSFTVTGNRSLVAKFNTAVTNYTISTSSSPTAGGTTSGGGTYATGSTAMVSASANSGYTFYRWEENGTAVSTSATYSFPVTGNRSLVAKFNSVVTNYTISTSSSPTAGGTTTGGGTYASGSTATVSASANSGYTFYRWEENGTAVSTSAAYSFTVTGNRSLVARFNTVTTNNYTISTSSSPTTGGTTSGGGTYAAGTTATIMASANSGYTFYRWEENGVVVSTNATYSFTVTGNRSLVARFNTVNTNNYTISTSSSPTTGGTTSGSGTYAAGSTATVTALASSGYVLYRWEENGVVASTNASYSFTVTGNRSLVAMFNTITTNNYTVSTSSSPTTGGTTSGGGTYAAGSTTTVTASANTGFSFVNWQEGNVIVSSSATYTFTVNSNRNLAAIFNQIATGQPFILTVTSSSGNEISHLTWPFASGLYAPVTTPNWQVTRDYWLGGWDGGNPSASGHGSGGHFGGEYYADDYNKTSGSGDCNTIFKAPLGGKVIYISNGCSAYCGASNNTSCGNGFGNTVIIQSTINNNFAFRVSHLNTVSVSLNAYISAGTAIGTIGSTGNSTGAHAHCCLYQNIYDYYGQEKAIQRLKRGQSLGMTGPASNFAANFKFDAITGGGGGLNLIPDDDNSLFISPNPTSGNFNLQITSDKAENTLLHVYSTEGKQMKTEALSLVLGVNTFTRDYSQLPPGLYLLVTYIGNERYSGKLIITR